MTRLIISAALVLTPSPITAPKDATPWQPLKQPASTAIYEPSTSPSPIGVLVEAESSSVAIANLVPVEELKPPESPPPEMTPPELVDAIFGWPGRMLVQCESRWNRWAVGSAGERGPLQIHPVHRYGIVAQLGYTWDQMFEWEPNLRVAVEIRRVQGLRAWTCWRGAA